MLQRLDLASGAVFEICALHGLGVGGAWLEDGTVVFGMLRSGLLRVSSSGGTPSPVTHLLAAEGDRDHLFPQALPGRRFLYLAQHEERENNIIYAASLDHPDQRVKVLASGYGAIYAPGHLLFMRGGTLMAQDFDGTAMRLSGEPEPLANVFTGLIPITNASVSGNGVLLYDGTGPKNRSSGRTGGDRSCGRSGNPDSMALRASLPMAALS